MTRTLVASPQPATGTVVDRTRAVRPPRTDRPPLPNRPPLRPAAYLARTAPTAVPEPRRAGAMAGAGALTAVLAVVIATVAATALGGVWLLLVRLAG